MLVRPNGMGKTMMAKNLGSACLDVGHTVRFTTASHMLNQLAAEDSPSWESRARPNPILAVSENRGLSRQLMYGARGATLMRRPGHHYS